MGILDAITNLAKENLGEEISEKLNNLGLDKITENLNLENIDDLKNLGENLNLENITQNLNENFDEIVNDTENQIAEKINEFLK